MTEAESLRDLANKIDSPWDKPWTDEQRKMSNFYIDADGKGHSPPFRSIDRLRKEIGRS